VVPSSDLDILVLPGTVVRARLQVRPVAGSLPAHSDVGSLHVTAGSSVYDAPLVTTDQLPEPGFAWRLTRLMF
jgi:hypothetical protein